jgi:hypothetical protein
MTSTADTLPAPATPTLEQLLLAGLTANADETPGISVFADAASELDAVSTLLGTDPTGEPLDRPAMLVVLDGIERRLMAGLALMRRERAQGAQGALEITRDAETEGGAS